jgi:hypothetical protein
MGRLQLWRRLSAHSIKNVETTESVKISSRRATVIIGAVLACLLVVAISVMAMVPSRRPIRMATIPPVKLNTTAHLPLPAEVRGIYVTASTASSLKRYVALLASAKAKGINTIVLDVKADNGALAFEPATTELKSEAPVKKLIIDLDGLVAATHAAGFYLIARLPVFEDPAFAAKHPETALHQAEGGLWHDTKGLAWLDPAAVVAWKYNADIAREVYSRGFDEVQFDYVRFATDGKTSNIVFPIYDAKQENMRGTIAQFFAYMDKTLRGTDIPISVDVFGFTTWHLTDLGIGQWYADALRHFDFVSPMVYPSHYPDGTLGFKNPADHPYEIVSDSLKKGNEVIVQLASDPAKPKIGLQRPWLQAFNLGAVYTPEMILAQVKAAREAGSSGFLLWNASNNYSSLPLISNP